MNASICPLLRQAREHPEMFLVLAEIHARSARSRNPYCDECQRAQLEETHQRDLRAGIGCGDFDPALGTEVAAELVVALIRGVNFGSLDGLARAERALEQLMIYLMGRE